MSDPVVRTGDDAARGEVLGWQANYRLWLGLAVAGGALLLRTLGVVSADSVGAAQFGRATAALGFAITALVYALLALVVRWKVRSTGEASRLLVRAQLAMDVLAVHACAFWLTPPAQYDRTLILSMFLVQFTQLYFGWRTTLFQLATVAVSYTSIVTAAHRSGRTDSPMEELWTFALFCLGATMYAWILGHQGVRMKRLTRLFEKAREGEFDERYEDGRDRFPDYITQIGRAYNDLRGHLETIILTDPLSGCFNRRGFKQLSEREVSRGIRAKSRLAVLALDVDHFKQINDDFGHLTGDEAIKEIGALIREVARESDVVARTGGEEFSILAPDTDEAGAMHLSERIMHAFRERSWASLRGQTKVTISIGVASDDAAADDVIRILTARADEALYVAKRSGRNQAVLWQTGMRAFDSSGMRPSREIERMP